jgi:hypothetical protein
MTREATMDVACEIVIQVIGGVRAEHRFALLVVDCDGGCEVLSRAPWTEKEITAFLEARYEARVDVAQRIQLARTQWAASSVVPRPSRASRGASRKTQKAVTRAPRRPRSAS